MNTAKKKLIFFDIDGTIVTETGDLSDRYIPESFSVTLEKLQANGHLCFINTGRSYAEVEEKLRKLPFDGLVCGCGSYIMLHDKILFHKTLPTALRKELLHDLNAFHLEWLLEGSRFIYYSSRKYTTHIGDFMKDHLALIPDAVRILPPETDIDLDFDKLCICLGKNNQFKEFHEKYKNTLTFIDRGNNFFEITPLHVSKASGIQFLEDYFHMDRKDTISVGDSTNDLPMLTYTAYSICMGNGAKELFDIVDYVTDSVKEDGILHAMQHLKLI
ncbi:MAG: HAD family hydrolase [Lachnospiraceae bacterium]|nr:HAD family hydrolase [Lachnospiraceae bacterium]